MSRVENQGFSYYGQLHTNYSDLDDEKYLGRTPTEAVKLACRIISDRKGYIVYLRRRNDWSFNWSHVGLVYYDGKSYYKGKGADSLVRIDPTTGRTIPKKRVPAPFGL